MKFSKPPIQIKLDIVNNPCPNHLGVLDSPKPIGCAMGEVLFQAGIPLRIIAKYSMTKSVTRNSKWRRLLYQFLGAPEDGSRLRWTPVEVAYDRIATYMRGLSSVGARRRLLTNPGLSLSLEMKNLHKAGLAINVEFILGEEEQQLSSCPLQQTEAHPAQEVTETTVEPVLA